MKKELIQEYTARISQCNRSQLVVVVYEIMIDYIREAKVLFGQGDKENFILNMKYAQNCLGDLIHSLDFKYPVSQQLFNLYLFWNKQITASIVKNSPEPLEGLEGMMKKMRDSFEKVSKEDNSSPLMHNTQKVYAGLTYGKQSLSEMTDIDINRGFQA